MARPAGIAATALKKHAVPKKAQASPTKRHADKAMKKGPPDRSDGPFLAGRE